jgi:2-dehydropantoate 2-reductase
VLGTGALGCAFAARLARADADVTLAGAWKEGLRALERDGVSVEERGRSFRVPVRAVPREQAGDGYDLVLVLVKGGATAAVAPAAARAVAAGGIVLTLQNGMGHKETLRAAVRRAEVAAGTTTLGATLVAPGRVRVHGDGVLLEAGGRRRDAAAEALAAAGLGVERAADIAAALWRKLAVSCAVNPVTALAAIPNGALPGHPEAPLARAAAREVQALASACGVTAEGDWWDDALAVCRLTAGNRSSLLQDLERGRETEIECLCGFVVRESERRGTKAPVNAELRRRVLERRGPCAS